MNGFSRVLCRIARRIAGPERREWAEAMAAEAAAIEGSSAAWSLGCVWASVKDRFARDWWLVPMVLLVPLLILAWKGVVFFSTSSLLVHQRIPSWAAVASWILSPFPLVFLLALWRRERSAQVALAISFLAVEAAPLLMMWSMGFPPSDWFGPHLNWYKCDPDIRIGLLAGISLDLLAWLAAAWLGSIWGRRLAH